jgi:hypothetical protein
LLSIISILYFLIEKKKKKLNLKIYYFYLFIYLFISIPLETKVIKIDFDKRIEFNKIQEFLNKNSLKNTNLKLFTNDLSVMNLWIFNKNSQLIISDAFINSLKNNQIEFNLLNSLKDFKVTENQFKKIISYGEHEIRNELFMLLFTYRYQANSLHTYSDLKNYTKSSKILINKTSPFRAQLQIIPEDEKKRLLKKFNNLQVVSDYTPDYVVINNLKLSKTFLINNNNYLKLFSSNNYDIYKKNY